MPARNSMRYIFSLIWFVSLDRHWHMFFMNGTLFFFFPLAFFSISDIFIFLFFSPNGPSCFLLCTKSSGRERDRNVRCASKPSNKGCRPRWCRGCLPSTFRVRFFYNPARWQWRQRLPNDPSFLSRGFSVFFFCRAENQESRGTAINDRKNIPRDLHRAFRSLVFSSRWSLLLSFLQTE